MLRSFTIDTKLITMWIFYTDQFSLEDDRILLLKHLEKWSEEYVEQQSQYKVMPPEEPDYYSLTFRLALSIKSYGSSSLVNSHIKESFKESEPVTIISNIKGEQFENPLNPFYVVKIGNSRLK